MALYRCGSGGESSTPITPSNSSPVALTANTAVKPTASGYAIASYSHITPSNSSPVTLSTNIYQSGGSGYAIRSYSSVTPSSTPESVSSGDIVKIGGSGIIVDAMPPTPTSITPSNATPAALTADAPVTPTTAGYAIESYNTKTPSNATPAHLVSGEIDKMGGTGYAIESYTTLTNLQTNVSKGDMLRVNEAGKVAMLQQLTPSNTSPPSIDNMFGYYAAPTSGYVISSYSSVTPSSTPTSVSAGNMVQIGGSGVIVDSVPTPTSLTPSNSSPATITSGTLYSATANGKAVASVTDVTPSDSTPPSISSGDIIKSSASGYLYATQQSGGMTKTTLWTNPNTGTNFAGNTITLSQNMTDFDYIGIYYRGVRTSNPSIESEILVTPTNFAKSKTTTNNSPLVTIGGVLSSGTNLVRLISYAAVNKLLISDAKAYGSSTTNNAVAFPLYVYGYKL